MSDLIVTQDAQALVDGWLEAERNGQQFPVDFDVAWQIAGYATKASAKRAIKNFLSEDEDYVFNKVLKNSQGRSSEDFRLTCDALKELCMISRSEIGKATRKYFIEAEKKWQLVQKHYPQIADDIEILREREQQKTIDKQIELQKLINRNNELNYSMVTFCGKEIALALNGQRDQIVKEEIPTLEVIDNRTGTTFKGQTLAQIQKCLAKRGIVFKSGAEIKRYLKHIEKTQDIKLLDTVSRPIDADYVPKKNLEQVYKILSSGSRQAFIGENA